LTAEKGIWYDKVGTLRNDNQIMGREITKDKYHNKRDDDEKSRKKMLEDLQLDIDALKDEIFKL